MEAGEDDGMRVERLGAAEALRELDALVELAKPLAGAPQWPWAVWERMTSGLDAGSDQAGRVLFASADGVRLAGFVICTYAAGEAEIESIAVSEGQQRRGVGRALLNAAVAELDGRGVVEIHLEVRASNAKAIGFYRAVGFAERGRRAGYYSEPAEDAVLMSRRLK